jgi:hypothetical protein
MTAGNQPSVNSDRSQAASEGFEREPLAGAAFYFSELFNLFDLSRIVVTEAQPHVCENP